MRLADFIVSNVEPILMEWEVFARGITPGAKLEALVLRDHAPNILLAIVQYMGVPQCAAEGERSAESTGDVHAARSAAGRDTEACNTALNGASDQHALARLGSGFDLLEVFSEYRALRASVLRLWRDSRPAADERDVEISASGGPQHAVAVQVTRRIQRLGPRIREECRELIVRRASPAAPEARRPRRSPGRTPGRAPGRGTLWT